MNATSTFQELILRLERFWADNGCIIWQPLSEKVGAGTLNPSTALRVLGPEPWNVAYVEPSFRPDDGRFGENPNRMQMHTQYQVVLKPEPGNPQELYLDSLEALGLNRRQHDIRFVEDNWESPALGAWGLGWEVWLDGLEITQFTYFQQAGGLPLDPVPVEITYGMERIAMYVQDVREVWQLRWNEQVTYGDILRRQEVEYCNYEFYYANVKRLQTMFNLFLEEAGAAIDRDLVIPAHDYVLRCSHTFNLLDTRGAIGVTERARYFAQIRDLARQVAEGFVRQREASGHPLIRKTEDAAAPEPGWDFKSCDRADLLLEIGSEELPPHDVRSGIEQLESRLPELLREQRLGYDGVEITGTPRRLVASVRNLEGRQPDREREVRGPAVKAAYDGEEKPTRALEGFCRGQGVSPGSVEHRKDDKGIEYVYARRHESGLETQEILTKLLPELIAGLNFPKTMRWDSDGFAYPRPLRWIVALFGNQIIPFPFARIRSGRTSHGSRPEGTPPVQLESSDAYHLQMEERGLIVNRDRRRETIWKQVLEQARVVGGSVQEDPDLLDEVTDLVEAPFALRGGFDEVHLELPQEVLVTVLKKYQRYFPVVHPQTGRLLPYFVAVSNGRPADPGPVIRGNENVVRARYADAAFFYREDGRKPLEAYLPRLDTLTYQDELGSVRDKSGRIERLLTVVAPDLGLTEGGTKTAKRAARLSKADLATGMVVEMTTLQGVMGRYYALMSRETDAVAMAIQEHYLPRFPGDMLPASESGFAVSVADRLDSLAGLFCAGIKPRSTADPYGLRRDALGLLALLIGKRCHFSLKRGLEAAATELPVRIDADRLNDAYTFILRRLGVQLKEEGFRHDVVEAALAGGCDDPFGLRTIVEGLDQMVRSENWTERLHAYARCKRIVRNLDEIHPLNPDADPTPSSRRLHQNWRDARCTMDRSEDKIDTLENVLADLRGPINSFFEEVLVMDEDPVLRGARLALVQRIASLADGIADLSRLEGY